MGVKTLKSEQKATAAAKRRRKREAAYMPSEGFCLPAWLSNVGIYTARYSRIKRAHSSTRKRQEALCALLQDVRQEMVNLLLSYPGSRAERALKDLYTTARRDLADAVGKQEAKHE